MSNINTYTLRQLSLEQLIERLSDVPDIVRL